MRYVLLIYSDMDAEMKASPEQQGELFGGYGQFTEDIKKSGHYVSGEPLQPTLTATTVKVDGGKAVTKDGPYAETKEQLGGFYIVECKDLDEATGIAERICRLHTFNRVEIEVRPVLDIAEMMSQSAGQ